MGFDPTKFGGKPELLGASRGGRRPCDMSGYVRHKDDKLRFKICAADMQRLTDELGISRYDVVAVCPVPEEGSILVWQDDGSFPIHRKLSGGKGVNSGMTFSMEANEHSRCVQSKFGNFTHIYCTLTFVDDDGDRAAKFTPNGRRD